MGRCRHGLFQAFQATLAVAVLLGLSAWLHQQAWVGRDERTTPATAQSPGLRTWPGSQLGLGRAAPRDPARPRGLRLLEPGWRTVDGCVLVFLVVSQLIFTFGVVLPEIIGEYVPRPPGNEAAPRGLCFQRWLGGSWPSLASPCGGPLGQSTARVGPWRRCPWPGRLPAGGFRLSGRAGGGGLAGACRWASWDALDCCGCAGPCASRCAALGIGWTTREDIAGWVAPAAPARCTAAGPDPHGLDRGPGVLREATRRPERRDGVRLSGLDRFHGDSAAAAGAWL